ncbi:MAG: hypothetical protein ACI92N_003398 [Pseudomonadales bacterium]|jgi:hypothetical protein
MFEFIQRKRLIFALSLTVGSALLILVLLLAFEPPAQVISNESPDKKLVRYSFTLANQSAEAVEDVVFRAFAPVEKTPFQRVDSINSSEQFQLSSDAFGNQELEYRIEELPPYGQKLITVSVELSVWNTPRNVVDEFVLPALRQSRLAPLVDDKHMSVESALNDLRSSTPSLEPFSWMKAASSWVHQSIEDVGYVSRDRGALFALVERKGDCTEFMHALVALARTQQIPSLPVAGFRVDGSSAILKAMDYHNWVMFEADGEWGVADPHANVFESHQGAYLVFRMLATHVGYGENSQRFFIHDPRVKVAMN